MVQASCTTVPRSPVPPNRVFISGINNLTDRQAKNLKPGARRIKIGDGDKLWLFVSPSGIKVWRMFWKEGNTQKQFIIGPYPTISLKEAREKRDAVHGLLVQGLDPNEQYRAEQKQQDEEPPPYLPRCRSRVVCKAHGHPDRKYPPPQDATAGTTRLSLVWGPSHKAAQASGYYSCPPCHRKSGTSENDPACGACQSGRLPGVRYGADRSGVPSTQRTDTERRMEISHIKFGVNASRKTRLTTTGKRMGDAL